MIDTVATLLGVSVSEPTREFISRISPVNAYFQTAAEVYSGVSDQCKVLSMTEFGSNCLIKQMWFYILVMVGWATVVPLIGT